jgi:hypothetical protein
MLLLILLKGVNSSVIATLPLGDGVTPLDLIHIHDLRLWAHVGVLDHERRDGQWFQLDITLGLDLSASAKSDDLSATADYSLAVQGASDDGERAVLPHH